MTSEEIVASITAHYAVTDRLTAPQLQDHKRRGTCPACERGVPLVGCPHFCSHRCSHCGVCMTCGCPASTVMGAPITRP